MKDYIQIVAWLFILGFSFTWVVKFIVVPFLEILMR